MTDKRVEPLQAQGKTVVFVLIDGELKGAIALADIIRPESKQAIDELKAMDIRCMMLTGDNKARPNGFRTRSGWMNTSPKSCPGTKPPK